MSEVHICKSCGVVMKKDADFAGSNRESDICSKCTDKLGMEKNFEEVVEAMKDKFISQMQLSEDEAEKMAIENVNRLPLWAHRQQMLHDIKNLIITDVGSTTTKAILLQKQDDKFKYINYQTAGTTVEKPVEDVKIGVFQAIQKLEKDSGVKLLDSSAEPANILLKADTALLSTSSAGGGLQILVIGLTMFDSTSSGQRAAYGAGGVLLDSFAIDDKRSSLEQMQAMSIQHPDIILMCGGVDGGAISSILRLGEILQLADPSPKFGEKQGLPLVFAGNVEAQPYIAGLFDKRFDLYMTPNLRPTMNEENLLPAREKIHQLFLENVMEQAPGYSGLKKVVQDNIIPTPLGVIRALQMVSDRLDANVMAVDIGGATTDMFSNILNEYFRTVSANYGMSYSISNVLKDAGLENVQRWLPSQIDEKYLFNYVGNKMLYPTYNPTDDKQIAIEQAVAREAIRMSKKQHLKMNFNTKQLGFLDKIKASRNDLEKITEAFYLDRELEKRKFHMHDIDILIGAGGVISHTTNQQQALSMIYHGFQPEGITEIWKDRDFITPHLGKLSSIDQKTAVEILENECFEKVGVAIRPVGKKWKANQKVMTIDWKNEKLEIKSGELRYFANTEKNELQIKLHKNFYLQGDAAEISINTSLPILIDTRFKADFTRELAELTLFNNLDSAAGLETDFKEFITDKPILEGSMDHLVELPYAGDILVKVGDAINPETVVGENRYDPPKVYVISMFDKSYLRLDADNYRESLRIKEGDHVKLGQRLVEVGRKNFIDELQFQHFYFDSPVRGRVERINYEAGTILMREIQDYSTKPKTIKASKILNIKPILLPRYMKKAVGDFVYAGELLASRIFDSKNSIPMLINSPTTGSIKEVNTKTGTITIQYDRDPYLRMGGIYGEVKSIEADRSAVINFEGAELQGIIGFGAEAGGKIQFCKELKEAEADRIIVFAGKISFADLQKLKAIKVAGIIAASIDNVDLIKFTGVEIGVALTGTENIPFPLIITEGFGEFSMQSSYVEFLKKSEGKWCFINGHTQIRAGVVRPKIIVQ